MPQYEVCVSSNDLSRAGSETDSINCSPVLNKQKFTISVKWHVEVRNVSLTKSGNAKEGDLEFKKSM